MEIQQTGLNLIVQKLDEDLGIISFKFQEKKCENWENDNKKTLYFDQNSFVELPADDNGEIKKLRSSKSCSLFKKADVNYLIDRLLPQAENWVNTKNSISDSLKKLLGEKEEKLIKLNQKLKISNFGLLNK